MLKSYCGTDKIFDKAVIQVTPVLPPGYLVEAFHLACVEGD